MTVITRTELLESFKTLERQFNQALHKAKEKNSDFEEIRKLFRQQVDVALKEAQNNFPAKHPLTPMLDQTVSIVKGIDEGWNQQINSHNKGLEFRQDFGDSLLVFIYGKVKSGKSSLGNYVAWGHTDPTPDMKARIPENQQPRYKTPARNEVQGGDSHNEAMVKKEFRVGATEATSSIQCFTLPGLTWVDSPGLHSMTRENGDLAKEYADHADLILYTMKSSEPGRSTDIKEILSLLNKEKKILLLITGSDDVEEDIDQTGQIIKTIIMKNEQRCADQREWVKKTLNTEGIDTRNIQILSLSARYAQQYQNDEQALVKSGMSEFFQVLSQTAQAEGVRLKRTVPLSNFKVFVENCRENITPYRQFLPELEKTIIDLEKKQEFSVREAIRVGHRQLQDFIDKTFNQLQASEKNIDDSAITQLQTNLTQHYIQIVSSALSDMAKNLLKDFNDSLLNIQQTSSIKLPQFMEETVQKTVASHVEKGNKGILGGFGALVGTVIGTALAGPVGAAIGGTVGGALGSVFGNNNKVQTKDITIAIGDNLSDIRHSASTQYKDALEQDIQKNAAVFMEALIAQNQQLFSSLNAAVENFDKEMSSLLASIDNELHNLN